MRAASEQRIPSAAGGGSAEAIWTMRHPDLFLPSARAIRRRRAELIEQRFGLQQIRRVEPFGEPAVDRREHGVGLIGPALVSPELGEANGRAQFPEPRALPPARAGGGGAGPPGPATPHHPPPPPRGPRGAPLEAAPALRFPAAAVSGQ